MSDLTEFLLARIAEDERRYDGDRSDYGYGWQHMLAECGAKRRIVEMMGRVVDEFANEVLYALASVYADHPDYREEWKP
jgi:hypothetical protein